MARLSRILLALVLAAAGAATLASCGDGSSADLLPGTTANQINANLDELQRLVTEGDCIGAEDAVAEVTAQVEDLRGVDRKLQVALKEGTAQLSEVVGECQEASEAAEPSAEPDVEAEELEREEQEAGEKAEKAKEKAEKHGEPGEESGEEDGNLPPQSNGKGKAKGHEEPPPPTEPETETEESPSGGVGPGVGVEG
jgi:hypothetical protein